MLKSENTALKMKHIYGILILVSFFLLFGCSSAPKNTHLTESYVTRGFQNLKEDNLEKASELFHKALSEESKCGKAYLGLGKIWLKKESSFRAKLFFHRAIETNPSLKESYCRLGNIYLGKGKLDKALRLFDDCPSKLKLSTRVYFNLGKYYLKQQTLNKALDMFKKARRDSQFWGGFWGAGIVHLENANLEKATSNLQYANALIDKNKINLKLATALDSLGRREKALLMYGKYIKNASHDGKDITSVKTRRDSLKQMVAKTYEAQLNNLDREISFSLRHNEKLRVNVYDLEGNCLKSLYNGFLARGNYDLDWKGVTDGGGKASEGLYIGFVEGCTILKAEPIYIDPGI